MNFKVINALGSLILTYLILLILKVKLLHLKVFLIHEKMKKES